MVSAETLAGLAAYVVKVVCIAGAVTVLVGLAALLFTRAIGGPAALHKGEPDDDD